MTREAELLQAIHDEPEDNDIRLVYADWLEDHDRLGRAEFIRLQIACNGRDADDPEVAALVARQSDLSRQHRIAWLAELPLLPQSLKWGDFRRGFVEEVVADWGPDLLAHQAIILDAIPLRGLCLRGWRAGHSLAGSALLARVREVRLTTSSPYHRNNADDLALTEVLSWPERDALTSLALVGFTISEGMLAQLAQTNLPSLTAFKDDLGLFANRSFPPVTAATWLGQLDTFELTGHPIPADRFRDLCSQLNGERLRRLTLSNARITDDDARLLAWSGLLANLEVLTLDGNQITSVGLRELLRGLPARAHLLIGGNPLGEEGFRLLASSPHLLRLTRSPSERFLSEPGYLALVRSPYARNLREVPAGDQPLSAQAINELLTSPSLESLARLNWHDNPFSPVPICQRSTLESLHLAGNNLDDASLRDFCTGSHLPRLRRLDFSRNRLGVRTAEALGSASGFPALKHLGLSRNPLGDAGAIALLAGTGLPALEELDVRSCGLSQTTLQAWAASPRLAHLKKIWLVNDDDDSLPPDAYAAFCEAALQRGCEIDPQSRKRRLRSIRRPVDGSPLPPEERLALVPWIQELRFSDYHEIGWLKAFSLSGPWEDDAFQITLHKYRAAPDDVVIRRAVINGVVRMGLQQDYPDRVSIWQFQLDAPVPTPRADALVLVDRILASSQTAAPEAVRGLMPPYRTGLDAPVSRFVVTGDEPLVEIPWTQIRTWFTDELFDPAQVTYFAASDRNFPRVIALDRDVIAILWLEVALEDDET